MEAQSKHAIWLAVLVLTITSALAELHPFEEPDFWWHLYGGRNVLEHGWFVYPDHSTFTQDGWPLDAEWVFQILAWGAWSAAEAVGITALVTMLAGACAFTVSLLALRVAGDRPWRGILTAALVVGVLSLRFAPRPQMLFLFYLGLALFLLEKPPSWRLVAGLAGLQLLWAHTHSSHVILPMIVGLRALGWLHRDGRSSLRHSVPLLGAAGLVALLLGPKGPWFLRHLLTHPATDSSAHIGEWQPMSWETFVPDSLGAPAALWAVLGLAAWALLTRRVRWDDVLLAILGGLLCLTAIRFRATWALLCLPLAVRGAGEVARWPKVERISALLAALLVMPLLWFGRMQQAPWFLPGLGAWQDQLPVEAADLLERQSATGHLYNHYNDGGYLLWRLAPKVKVAIDGRTPAFHSTENHALWRQSSRSFKSFEGMDARWDIHHALVDRDLPLCQRLALSQAWRLIYLDSRSALFTELDSTLLPGVELTALPACIGMGAACPSSQEEAKAQWREIDQLLALNPEASWPHLARVRVLACQQDLDPQLALSAAEAVVRLELASTDAQRVAHLLAVGGSYQDALDLLERVSKREDDPALHLMRAKILQSLARPGEAAEVFGLAAKTLDDNLMHQDRSAWARALLDAGRSDEAYQQALRAGWAAEPGALALLEEMLPHLEEARAEEARLWIRLSTRYPALPPDPEEPAQVQ